MIVALNCGMSKVVVASGMCSGKKNQSVWSVMLQNDISFMREGIIAQS